ncbi:MAG: orotidine 5'-phosphate decarboxylase, partial [Clostridia bacterium]|nr:orotidine 5'-phosphate decarboxylase [Clostridia bacterium]
MIIDRLIDKIKLTDNPSVIGLDTCIDYLPDDMKAKCVTLSEAGKQITKFNFDLIDTLKDVIPAVKVQVAYYEMYGVDGMIAFRDTIKYARENGLLVIADIKRNDIGSTAGAYSKGYIGKTTLADGSKVT